MTDQIPMDGVPAKAKRERPRDVTWDTLSEEFGEPRTENEAGRRRKAVRQLKQAEATPEEIRIAVSFCKRKFTSYTELAVCSWLSESLREHSQTSEKRNAFMAMLNPNGEVK